MFEGSKLPRGKKGAKAVRSISRFSLWQVRDDPVGAFGKGVKEFMKDLKGPE